MGPRNRFRKLERIRLHRPEPIGQIVSRLRLPVLVSHDRAGRIDWVWRPHGRNGGRQMAGRHQARARKFASFETHVAAFGSWIRWGNHSRSSGILQRCGGKNPNRRWTRCSQSRLHPSDHFGNRSRSVFPDLEQIARSRPARAIASPSTIDSMGRPCDVHRGYQHSPGGTSRDIEARVDRQPDPKPLPTLRGMDLATARQPGWMGNRTHGSRGQRIGHLGVPGVRGSNHAR